jgi:hypothetical protein
MMRDSLPYPTRSSYSDPKRRFNGRQVKQYGFAPKGNATFLAGPFDSYLGQSSPWLRDKNGRRLRTHGDFIVPMSILDNFSERQGGLRISTKHAHGEAAGILGRVPAFP